MLQTLVPAYKNVTVKIAFGAPLDQAAFLNCSGDTLRITEMVICSVRALLENEPREWEVILDVEGETESRKRPRTKL
jgi:hypothetical protein